MVLNTGPLDWESSALNFRFPFYTFSFVKIHAKNSFCSTYQFCSSSKTRQYHIYPAPQQLGSLFIFFCCEDRWEKQSLSYLAIPWLLQTTLVSHSDHCYINGALTKDKVWCFKTRSLLPCKITFFSQRLCMKSNTNSL